MSDEIEYFNNKRPDRVYISKSINEPLQKAVFNSEGRLVEIEESNRCLRYLSRVFDSDDIHEFAKIKNEVVIRSILSVKTDLCGTLRQRNRRCGK